MTESALTSPARPIIVILLALTFCILAIAQSAGVGTMPREFMAVAIPIITEWVGERAFKRYKEGKV